MNFEVGFTVRRFPAPPLQTAPFPACYAPMSGMFVEYSGVRFSPRIRFWELIMRMFASPLVRWRSHAARESLRISSTSNAAEFSAATRTAFERLKSVLGDRRAGDRASNDALRPNYNSVNTEDLYAISIIREKLAATARRLFPTPERRPFLPAKINPAAAGQEIILGQNRGLFLEWKTTDGARRTATQWSAYQSARAAGARCAQA